jgi:hypothetical protein
MVYSLSYRRPSRVSDESSVTSTHEKRSSRDGSYLSGTSGSIKGIPEALSFDRIIAGGTCPVRNYNLMTYRTLISDFVWVAMHHARLYELSAIHRTQR